MLSASLTDNVPGRQFVALPQDQRDLAARLGTELLDHTRACAQNWGDDEWQQRLNRMQASMDVLEKEACSRIKSAVAQALTAERASSEAEYARVREEVERLRAQLSSARETADARCDQQVGATRVFYEKKLDACQARLEEALGANQNSTKKGQRGEEHVLSRLNMLFPKADIEDTHATPGRGDFVVTDNGIVMMIEAKNYTRNVQKAEVDKFYRDIESPANADFNCAVLVSLRSGVCCKDDFSFEMRGEKPVLFVHRLEDNYDSLLLAMSFFRLVLTAGESVDLRAKATEDSLRAAASALKRGYAKQRTRLNRFHTEQLALVAEQEARITELYTALGQKL